MKPGKEDFSTFYQQPIGGFQQDNPLNTLNPLGPTDPLHRSAYSTEESRNDWPDESLRGQSEQQVLMQPSLAHAWDVLPSSAHPQRPASREQTFSAPSRAPSAPAVLPFPKRPGDLFQ